MGCLLKVEIVNKERDECILSLLCVCFLHIHIEKRWGHLGPDGAKWFPH